MNFKERKKNKSLTIQRIDGLMDKNKIIHMSSVHTPFDVRIYHKECVFLSKSGYDVTIVVPSSMVLTDEYVSFSNVKVRRSRLGRIFITIFEIFFAAMKNKGNIYHFHDSELIPVGLALKFFGKKIVYDVHEDLPRQISDKPWLWPILRKPVSHFASILEFIVGQVFHGVIAVTPHIAMRFPKDKVCLLQNFPSLGEFSTCHSKNYFKRPLKAAYIGGITEIRGINQIVKAAELLPEIDTPMVMAGRFESTIFEDEIKKLKGWESVDFAGWKKRDAVFKLLGSVRVGLVLFHPVANHITAQPNKLFEYMAAGLPVIASDFPLWRRIVDENRCGLLVDPMSPKAIADAIRWIFEHPNESFEMGKRGRQAVFEKFNWDTEKRKLLKLYEKILR